MHVQNLNFQWIMFLAKPNLYEIVLPIKMEDADPIKLCIECHLPRSSQEPLSQCREKGKTTLVFYYQQLGRDQSTILERFEGSRLYIHENCRRELHNEVEKALRRKQEDGEDIKSSSSQLDLTASN